MPRNILGEEDEKKTIMSPASTSSAERSIAPPLKPFFQFQWLDCRDPQGSWFEAQVKEVKLDQHQVVEIFVHYKGFDASKYDEWIDVRPTELERLQLINTHSKPAANKMGHPLRLSLGLRLDILDTLDEWYTGVVHELKLIPGSTERLVRVSYDHHSNEWDEYIYSGSYRLAPLHTHTRAPTEVKQFHGPWLHPPQTPQNATQKAKHQYRAEPAEERKFRELMLQKGWRITDQGGDGNCLFRSVSHQMYGSPDYHELVRSKCVDYVISERQYFQSYIPGDFNSYVEEMKKTGTWGDHVEIQAMSEIYDRPIQIYAYSSTPLNIYQHTRVHNAPVRLSYHYQSHYNSIIDDSPGHKPLLNSIPGEVENEQINLSKKRGGRRFANDDLQKALAASRAEFQALQRADVDRAIYLSMRDEGKGMSEYDRAVLESLKDGKKTPPIGDLEQALQKSREQADAAELEKVKRESEELQRWQEEAETRRAKELSMQGVAEMYASAGFTDDPQLHLAIQASLQDGKAIDGFSGFGYGFDNLDEQRAIAMSLEQSYGRSNTRQRRNSDEMEIQQPQS